MEIEVINIHNAAMSRNLDTTLLRSFAVVVIVFFHARVTGAASSFTNPAVERMATARLESRLSTTPKR